MLKELRKNMNVIESMIYFWTAVTEREKVGETYLHEVSSYPEMSLFYDDEFSAESARKVLSAITNRELLNNSTLKERQFWNNNMWMTEDLENMNQMVAPLKVLNLDSIRDEINKIKDIKEECIEIIFVPANKEEFLIKDNKLIINFFKIFTDPIGIKEPQIADMNLVDYIKGKIIENF